jgi:hypothetical protein
MPSELVAERRLEPAMGFEPATACLQNRCSTIELRRRVTLRQPSLTEKKQTFPGTGQDFQHPPLITNRNLAH